MAKGTGEGRGWKAYVPTLKRLGQIAVSLAVLKVVLGYVSPIITSKAPQAGKVIPNL